ncbi:transcriptional regulator, TetR family [Variovorax sp. HW608]|nr:transcriptional regulator, TetR family [Variovorax sp. HW608]
MSKSDTKAAATTRRAGSRRRPQKRAIETRRAILDAALSEFAERGFEGASVRRIGERASLEYTLITYHFKNKAALWRAVATEAFAQMGAIWQAAAEAQPQQQSAADAVRLEVKAFLQFTVEHREFHHFMLQENHAPSPRLRWIVRNILSKARERIVPKIRQAQADGDMLAGDPDLIYYMLIGMVSVPSSLQGEMRATMKFSLDNPAAVAEYWRVIERSVFR